MNRWSNFLTLGLGILIMSSSGALGRYMDMEPPIVIWIRCVIGSLALLVLLFFLGISLKLDSRKQFYSLLISSAFLGAHWVTYFYSLKYSTVAIGMLSLFTYPVITSLLEPVMLKVKFQKGTLILAILSFVGVSLLVPEYSLDNEYTIGILIGIVSALVYSIRNIMLKKNISSQSGITLMFYQLAINVIYLAPFLFILDFDPILEIENNWMPLLILGLFTTAAGHTLFLLSFKHFTITTVSIISSITPLLGSLIGFVVLSELPANRTYIGGALILLTVIIESSRSAKANK